jgi:hypothetical protein
VAHQLGDGDQVDASTDQLGAEGVAEHVRSEGVERVVVKAGQLAEAAYWCGLSDR